MRRGSATGSGSRADEEGTRRPRPDGSGGIRAGGGAAEDNGGVNEGRSRVRLEAAGQDRDRALATLPSFYDGSSWASELTEGPYSYRYSAVGDTTMTLRTSRMRGYLEGDIPRGNDYVIQWIVAGGARGGPGSGCDPMNRGRPLVFPPPPA